MIRDWVLPGLMETGPVCDRVYAVRDGIVDFYAVRGDEGVICIDAGWREQSVHHGFQKLGLKIEDVVAVFLTHCHWDHARCAGIYANARIYSSAELADGQTLTEAGLGIRAISTAGHTPDSMCYLVNEKHLFTGDTIFLRKGHAHPFPSKYNNDQNAVRESIRKLANIPGVVGIFSAHTGAAFDVELAFRDWREGKS